MTKEILHIHDLHKAFGKLQVLKGIDHAVRKGEVVVIVGRSGSGKSTLLRCTNLLEIPDQGCLHFQAQNFEKEFRFENRKHRISASDLQDLRTHIGMVFQHFNLWPHLTALENVTLALKKAVGMSSKEADERGMRQLEKVGLAEKAQEHPGTLSGGQQQRVAIARALALDPAIMLFDEVTSALDPELVAGILEEMRRLAEEGMTMLVVTHEMGFAQEVGDRVVFMDDGVIIEEGPAREVISRPQHPITQDFLRVILH
ncbi:amino acid ABC transporter ATP-binding protein [Chloroflexota bacterium]